MGFFLSFFSLPFITQLCQQQLIDILRFVPVHEGSLIFFPPLSLFSCSVWWLVAVIDGCGCWEQPTVTLGFEIRILGYLLPSILANWLFGILSRTSAPNCKINVLFCRTSLISYWINEPKPSTNTLQQRCSAAVLTWKIKKKQSKGSNKFCFAFVQPLIYLINCLNWTLADL